MAQWKISYLCVWRGSELEMTIIELLHLLSGQTVLQGDFPYHHECIQKDADSVGVVLWDNLCLHPIHHDLVDFGLFQVLIELRLDVLVCCWTVESRSEGLRDPLPSITGGQFHDDQIYHLVEGPRASMSHVEDVKVRDGGALGSVSESAAVAAAGGGLGGVWEDEERRKKKREVTPFSDINVCVCVCVTRGSAICAHDFVQRQMLTTWGTPAVYIERSRVSRYV